MAEYIEREALMRRIKEIHCAECDSYHGVRCRACWVDDTLDYIDSEPAANVVPMRPGRWIKHGRKWQCTNCEVLMSIDGPPKENLQHYCPNCGAKMDGGAE